MSDDQLSSHPASEEWLRALLSSVRDVVLVRSLDGVVSYCSPSVQSVLGYTPGELEGTDEQALIHRSDRAMRDAVLDRLVSTNETQPPIELRLRNQDGSWQWFEVTDSDLLDDPDVHAIVTYARDITKHKAAAAELIDLSLRDALTGTANRLALIDRLEVALARTARTKTVLAVLFCDLDEFKIINDSLGHESGDGVLIEVANRLRRIRRGSDTVARTGGDEFVIVCDGLPDAQQAIYIASEVRDVIEHPMILGGHEATISVSIGIVTVDGAAATHTEPMTLLRNADAAMYRAKEHGKARWHVFDETLIDEVTQRFELEAELRPALEHGEFLLHYQPIFNLEHGGIVGVEALLRWNHPSRGFLLPGQFITVAEQTGLIVTIGAWVLEEACTQVQRWREDLGWPGWVSVNLSARQVAEPGLATTLRETLAATELDPDCLWLELTETALLRAGHSSSVELAAVQALGAHLGMDDFGTGYASLTNLQRLPIDFLKIDRSFVTTLSREGPGDGEARAIVAALTELGRGLSLSTVAEGIERPEELALLREFGCPYGQGYLLARPMPRNECTQLLTTSDPSARNR
jgi:diguanylate cyclase (GGDEF)-like protein/PAS domain S-box-containing protein